MMNIMPDEPAIPQIKVEDLPAAQASQPAQPVVLPKKTKKALLIALGIVGVLLIYSFITGFVVYRKVIALKNSATALVAAVKSKDLPKIKAELANTKKSLSSLKGSYKLIAPGRLMPILGGYIADGGRMINAGGYGLETADIVLTTIEPYADLLGLSDGKVKEAKDGEKTAKDRIDFIVKSIPDLIPKIDQINTKVSLIQKEVGKINPDRYPVKIGKTEVRAKVKAGLETFATVAGFITNGKPLLESAPYLLGIDSPRTYLVLFQNDKELRPTGGFLTAYSIMKVDKGKFSPVASSDMYNLDAKYRPSLAAPDPIIKYLKGPYVLSQKLRLRDMNWWPDFKTSMKTFTAEASKVGIINIDGVISVDTQVLVYLLDAIGKIGVPDFGNFSAEPDSRCNCPNVIYELEDFADIEGPVVWDPAGTGKIIYAPPNYDNRKKIIGPLMNSVLANAMGQPKDKLPALFEAGFKSLIEKHALFYLFDDKAQAAVEAFGIAGTIKETQISEDYLHINDANLGGRKSNLYVTQAVEQEYSVAKDGFLEKTITITYANPEKQDGWLNSVLPNWVRIYVPKGSTLISAEGLEDKTEPYEEFGKTVFAGFFKLRPEGLAKVTFKCKLPFKPSGGLKLLIQKQPGTDAPLYTIKAGKTSEELYLKTDKELPIRL